MSGHTATPECLPCPFCGCAKIDVYSDDGDHIAEISKDYAVQCWQCGARAPVCKKTEAIAAWNTRADSHADLVIALRRIVSLDKENAARYAQGIARAALATLTARKVG